MRLSFVKAFVAVAAFAFSVSLSAQDKPAAKEHTMTGCLQKGAAADTYVVQNTAEKGPKMIGIVESKAPLAGHVGHTIDIVGVNVPPDEAMKMNKNVPKADHYMTLSAIKMVSASCK